MSCSHETGTLTFLRQLLLDPLLRLLHVLVLGDVQLEDRQVAGGLPGQTLGPDALRIQAPGEHHKALVVQAACQLVPEAAVAAGDQHRGAAAVLHGAGAVAGHQLGQEEEQEGRDGDDADDLTDEERVHAGDVSVNQRVCGLRVGAAELTIYTHSPD